MVLFPALPPIGCVTISKSLHLSETHLPHLKRRGCWTRSVVLNHGWFCSHKRYLGKYGAFFIITVSVETQLALTEWAGMPNVHSAWHDPNKENPFHPKCLLRYCADVMCSERLESQSQQTVPGGDPRGRIKSTESPELSFSWEPNSLPSPVLSAVGAPGPQYRHDCHL